ncbi:fibronectin type III domain-containing protein [Nitrospira sp. NS4]|uniref:fibronectin type III domain-containing protein n=1 Tax=Nitrospira sp. NS4 TaxID=3414498 RepID=UPI003C30B5F1
MEENGEAAGPSAPGPSGDTTDQTHLPTDDGTGPYPGTSLNNTQPQSEGADSRPVTRSIALTWDPDPSGNTNGYRVYVRGESTGADYAFDSGPDTHLRMALPTGERYSFTVIAYNAAGESPPSSTLQCDLF